MKAHFEAFYKAQIVFFTVSFANLPLREIWWAPDPAFWTLALWFTLHMCNFGLRWPRSAFMAEIEGDSAKSGREMRAARHRSAPHSILDSPI